MTTGILAIWNDCAPGHLTAYEGWYQTEHLPERLSIPGIRRARRYVCAEEEGPAFFTYYEADTPDVMVSDDYLERVNNPTPRTKVIMMDAFKNMNRTICNVVDRQGRARGAWAVVHRVAQPPELNLRMLCAEAGVARAEIWQRADATAPENAEQKLRGPDAETDACLLIETLREPDAKMIQMRFPGALLYRLLCEMTDETAS